MDDNIDKARQAHDKLVDLAKLSVKFAEVERAPRYPNGKRENDAEHSFLLALSAMQLAVSYYPKLDVGLITQFCIVHDLPEAYTGDVWTINISDSDREKKELAEKDATQRLLTELPSHIAQLLNRYEKQIEPEARFVRCVDKLLPGLINMLTGDASTFKKDHNINNKDEFNSKIKKIHIERMQQMFPEFDIINKVFEINLELLARILFK